MRIISAIFFLPLLFSGKTFSSEPLKIITYNLPPYSMKQDNKQVGYATELVTSMLKELGTNSPIESYPLKRGVFIASNNSDTLIYPISRNDNLESNFHWIGKIASQRISFLKKASRKTIEPTTLEEAKQYDIGVVRGSYAENELKRLGFPKVHEVTDGTQNILKLENNRIDLIATDELVFNHYIDTYNRQTLNNLALEDYQALPMPESPPHDLYIAVSKKTSSELVGKLRTAYEIVQDSGKLLEVAHWWTFGYEKNMVDVYRNALSDKGYKWIDYTFEGGAGGNMTEILRSRISQYQFPHAIQTYGGPAVREWAEKGVLLPLNEVATSENWSSLLPEVINNNVKHNGQYVAVPVNLQRVNWMWLNPKVFEQSGADIPTTWEEFFVAADVIKQAGFIPVSIGGYSWQEGTLFESILLSIGGADFYKKALIELDEKAFQSSTMTEVLHTFRKVSQYTDNSKQNRDWLQAANMIIQGDAAIYFMGDWVNGVYLSENIPYGENGFLCRPVPNTEHLFLVNSDAFAFPKTGHMDIEGQMQLASVMMNKEVQKKFSLNKGSIPARLDVSETGFNQCAKESMALAKQGKLVPSFNFHQTLPAEIHEQIIDTISHFFRTDIPIAETQNTLYRHAKNYHLKKAQKLN
ncbi:extracellular solute-binding protein [Vibrio sp. HN007]|uniref:extracellular solute-binding protein n=1 Tax=Vibrio iocasae TaxID=3098914 RepID=UPI0035D4B89B